MVRAITLPFPASFTFPITVTIIIIDNILRYLISVFFFLMEIDRSRSIDRSVAIYFHLFGTYAFEMKVQQTPILLSRSLA